MITMLTRIGDDYALVIEQEMLDRLKITPDTPLEFKVENAVLWVTPITDVTPATGRGTPSA